MGKKGKGTGSFGASALRPFSNPALLHSGSLIFFTLITEAHYNSDSMPTAAPAPIWCLAIETSPMRNRWHNIIAKLTRTSQIMRRRS